MAPSLLDLSFPRWRPGRCFSVERIWLTRIAELNCKPSSGGWTSASAGQKLAEQSPEQSRMPGSAPNNALQVTANSLRRYLASPVGNS